MAIISWHMKRVRLPIQKYVFQFHKKEPVSIERYNERIRLLLASKWGKSVPLQMVKRYLIEAFLPIIRTTK